MSAASSDMTARYQYSSTRQSGAHAYLLPTCDRLIDAHFEATGGARRMFDVGCGNGSVGAHYAGRGIEVTGVDTSEEGIGQARQAFPDLKLGVGSAYDDLAETYGQFPVVISLEVVEHLYFPRALAKNMFDLLEPGGIALLSTPYHGYLKNLALAATNSMDRHFTALRDGGHIKFFSPQTLGEILAEAGFRDPEVFRVGRVPPLAKSMIFKVTKP